MELIRIGMLPKPKTGIVYLIARNNKIPPDGNDGMPIQIHLGGGIVI